MRALSGCDTPKNPTANIPPMAATAMRDFPRSRSAHLFAVDFVSILPSAIVAACYSLLATCYLLLATCYLLLATCYLLLVTCYLLLALATALLCICDRFLFAF